VGDPECSLLLPPASWNSEPKGYTHFAEHMQKDERQKNQHTQQACTSSKGQQQLIFAQYVHACAREHVDMALCIHKSHSRLPPEEAAFMIAKRHRLFFSFHTRGGYLTRCGYQASLLPQRQTGAC
jgi:hypothetical protein